MVIKSMRSKKGSTSILIVVMMVVLTVLGLAIMTTALSNKRLSDKKMEWKTDYYALESSANRIISQIMLEIDAINQKKITEAKGFANIGQILSEVASAYSISDFGDAKVAQIDMTLSAPSADKNLDIRLQVFGTAKTEKLKLKILEYRQWQ